MAWFHFHRWQQRCAPCLPRPLPSWLGVTFFRDLCGWGTGVGQGPHDPGFGEVRLHAHLRALHGQEGGREGSVKGGRTLLFVLLVARQIHWFSNLCQRAAVLANKEVEKARSRGRTISDAVGCQAKSFCLIHKTSTNLLMCCMCTAPGSRGRQWQSVCTCFEVSISTICGSPCSL